MTGVKKSPPYRSRLGSKIFRSFVDRFAALITGNDKKGEKFRPTPSGRNRPLTGGDKPGWGGGWGTFQPGSDGGCFRRRRAKHLRRREPESIGKAWTGICLELAPEMKDENSLREQQRRKGNIPKMWVMFAVIRSGLSSRGPISWGKQNKLMQWIRGKIYETFILTLTIKISRKS